MIICDLCRKPLKDGEKCVKNIESHICLDCIKTCIEIVNDPTTVPLVYLNEYRELKEKG